MRLSRDLIALTFFFQRRYRFNCILNKTFEISFTIKGSKGNVTIVVIIITTLISSVVIPVVSKLPVAVSVLSIVVLTTSGLSVIVLTMSRLI